MYQLRNILTIDWRNSENIDYILLFFPIYPWQGIGNRAVYIVLKLNIVNILMDIKYINALLWNVVSILF
jgi:hypothetical protein